MLGAISSSPAGRVRTILNELSHEKHEARYVSIFHFFLLYFTSISLYVFHTINIDNLTRFLFHILVLPADKNIKYVRTLCKSTATHH